MEFTKMHGCGNDYVYINCFKEKVNNPSELSIKMSDRHFGVGSDGLVLILPSEKADFRMRMYNSDGSEAEMCGNAIRCVGKYVYDRGMIGKANITIETLAGIKKLDLFIENSEVTLVTVDMGEPILDPEFIPVRSTKNPVIKEPLTVLNEEYHFTCVSMGNPHAITQVNNVKQFPLEKVGPLVEVNEMFPKKTNVEFVEILDRQNLNMRVWERGAGETLACGTGACATLVSCVLNNLSDRKATLHLLGGDLIIEWRESDNHVMMTGPAQFVFEGQWLL